MSWSKSKLLVAIWSQGFINSDVVTSHLPGWQVRSLRVKPSFKLKLACCYLGSLALIATALWEWGAKEVRGHAGEVAFLTVVGGVWLLVSSELFPYLGLSIADDAIERRNLAALIALSGAVLGIALIYAGGSLGEGPYYWTNIFSAAVGTVGFLGLWFLLELGGHVSVSITEERDLASGIRFAGFLLAVGLILGRVVAGNWHSESATISDFFRDGWPAAALCIGAMLLERFLRPGRACPAPGWVGHGLLPALAYLAFGGAWIVHLGRWEGMPK